MTMTMMLILCWWQTPRNPRIIFFPGANTSWAWVLLWANTLVFCHLAAVTLHFGSFPFSEKNNHHLPPKKTAATTNWNDWRYTYIYIHLYIHIFACVNIHFFNSRHYQLTHQPRLNSMVHANAHICLPIEKKTKSRDPMRWKATAHATQLITYWVSGPSYWNTTGFHLWFVSIVSTRQLFDHPFFEACEAGLARWFTLLMHGEKFEDIGMWCAVFFWTCVLFWGLKMKKVNKQSICCPPVDWSRFRR